MDIITCLEIYNIIQRKIPKESRDKDISLSKFINSFEFILQELKSILIEKVANNEFDNEYNVVNEQLIVLNKFYEELNQVKNKFLQDS